MSTLVLNGQTGYPLSYVGLTKDDFNHLHNVWYLREMKKSPQVAQKDNVIKLNNQKIKNNLLTIFKLKTINSQSCVSLDDLLIFCRKDFAERLKNKQLLYAEDCFCSITGKKIMIVDCANRRKYISFAWLCEICCSLDAGKYFSKRWLKKLAV